MSSAKTVITRNPATGEKLREYSFMDEVELEKVMARAQQAFGSWSTLKMEDRIQALDKLKASFLSHRGELGSLISTEMGKPLQQSFAEIDKSMDLITYCNKQAPKSLNPERRSDYTVLYQPLGVLYGIMPWNFPIWQAMRFCVPALLSGNTILLKPAENVAGSGQMMEDVFSAVPELRHVFNNIRIDHATSDSVIADPRVRGVSFTGSTNAGRHIAKTAGQFLKKNVLELGGNDAYIVFADADVPAAVKKIAQVRLLNAGQSCISAKRLIIEEKVVAEFMIGLQKELAQVRIGNPLDEGVALGPVARRDQQETLHKQLKKSLDEGAEIFYQVPLPEDLPKDS